MESAEAYRRENGLFIHSDSRSTTGLWVIAEPFIRLTVDEDPAAVGRAIVKALSASRDGVPHPPPSGELFSPMLLLAEVPSWEDFVKEALSVSVGRDDGWLTFSPSRYEPSDDSFLPTKGRDMRIPDTASPEDIGKALNEAFALCE